MCVKKGKEWTSLVVQWLSICLPMQGTGVWSLVRKDPTCHGAAKPVHHSCWARVPWAPIHKQRCHCSEEPGHRIWKLASPRCSWRTPMHNIRDPVQPEIRKGGRAFELFFLVGDCFAVTAPLPPSAVSGSFWRSTCQVLEGGGPWLWEAGVFWLVEGLMLQGSLCAPLAKSKQPPVC